jgi:D-xylose transport system substrate-binding protein
MGGSGSILMLNGAPTDPNAAQFKEGAHAALDGNADIIAEYDNPDWSPDNAQQWTTDQLGKFDPADIKGVYAANDGQAGGVVAAMTGAGVSPDALPPITGQDAELAAVQRIVAGEQFMTIYKSYKQEAEKAAEVAVDLANGEEITGTEDFEGVASFIFDPVVLTTENIEDTVIADELYSVEDICTANYADACAEAGLS